MPDSYRVTKDNKNWRVRTLTQREVEDLAKDYFQKVCELAWVSGASFGDDDLEFLTQEILRLSLLHPKE